MSEADGPKRRKTIVRLTRILAHIFLSPFFRIRTSGLEHLPKHRAFILLPKHQRWEDIPLLSIATPRYLYYIAKYELFANPVLGRFLFAVGGLPLNRTRPLESRQSLKVMVRYLKNGEVIVIFPEGTYFKDRVGAGHMGVIRLVRSRSRFLFIPVGIKYTKKFVRRHVQINFGEPIHDEPTIRAEDLLHRIMTEIARLSDLPELTIEY
ncbi:1-acyl-sn-glycerol-3-phosphate acyltransferase [bacterium]|nr:1-acyl-sn-glycerol-3-phosphate acyltransferase [bacterium]